MLDHISLRVSDYERSKAFYAAALAPLGYTLAMEAVSGAGFRKEFIPNFWIKQGSPVARRRRSGASRSVARLRWTFRPCRVCELRAGAWSTPSITPRWPPARATTGRLDCARPITRTTTARSFSIRMGTTSKRSATRQNEVTTERSGLFQDRRSTKASRSSRRGCVDRARNRGLTHLLQPRVHRGPELAAAAAVNDPHLGVVRPGMRSFRNASRASTASSTVLPCRSSDGEAVVPSAAPGSCLSATDGVARRGLPRSRSASADCRPRRPSGP